MLKGFQFRFVVLGKRWNFVRRSLGYDTNGHHIDGMCDPPDKPNKCVTVGTRVAGQEEMETTIHETLHAAAWHVLDEGFVEQTAKDLTRLLWVKLGYRKVELNDDAND